MRQPAIAWITVIWDIEVPEGAGLIHHRRWRACTCEWATRIERPIAAARVYSIFRTAGEKVATKSATGLVGNWKPKSENEAGHRQRLNLTDDRRKCAISIDGGHSGRKVAEHI